MRWAARRAAGDGAGWPARRRRRSGDRALGVAVHGEPAVGAEAVLAAVDRRAARAGGDAGVAQDRHRLVLGEGAFERAQLGVDVAERRELGEHQRVVALAEAVQVEDQAAEVAVGELARLAQEARAAAHAPALAEPGWPGAWGVAGRGRPARRRRLAGRLPGLGASGAVAGVLARPTPCYAARPVHISGRYPARIALRSSCSSAARQAAATRSAMRGPENGSACARPSTRGSRRAQVGSSAARQRLELERRAERARDARAAPRGGCRRAWRARARRRRAPRAPPGRSPRARRAQHRVGGVDPQRRRARVDAAEREQLDVDRARQRERQVVALARRAPGRRGTADRAARDRAPARCAPARGGSDGSARDPRRRAAPAPGARAARPGSSCASELETAAEQIDPAEHGAGDHRACGGGACRCRGRSARARGRHRERGPGGEAEVGVHDVEGARAGRRLSVEGPP